MIAGLGTDIVEIGRIVRMLDKFGDAFRERICTPAELAEGSRRRHASTYYAGRWAVKEAAAKALGCGIGKTSITAVTRPMLPFFGAMLFALLLITFIPALSMWLPDIAGLLK